MGIFRLFGWSVSGHSLQTPKDPFSDSFAISGQEGPQSQHEMETFNIIFKVSLKKSGRIKRDKLNGTNGFLQNSAVSCLRFPAKIRASPVRSLVDFCQDERPKRRNSTCPFPQSADFMVCLCAFLE